MMEAGQWLRVDQFPTEWLDLPPDRLTWETGSVYYFEPDGTKAVVVIDILARSGKKPNVSLTGTLDGREVKLECRKGNWMVQLTRLPGENSRSVRVHQEFEPERRPDPHQVPIFSRPVWTGDPLTDSVLDQRGAMWILGSAVWLFAAWLMSMLPLPLLIGLFIIALMGFVGLKYTGQPKKVWAVCAAVAAACGAAMWMA